MDAIQSSTSFSDMYDSFSRLFEQLWESAGEAETR